LDCRFIQAQASHVKIYAREDNFDRDIPLFGIENRDVEIINSLDFLEHPSFVLVEGGEGMLEALKEKIDWMLIYQTPKLSTNNLTYNTTMNLHFLHQEKKEIDLMIWSKQVGH
jgi:diaminohydroxyphosphoribosylaminopyrimidine deaminase/5-amino-6-(5-phosphoribosylamino)uracil reductase